MSEDPTNPEPKGEPHKHIVVDRNEWKPGSEEHDFWSHAFAHADHIVDGPGHWAKRFDRYILHSEYARLEAQLEVAEEALKTLSELEITIGYKGGLYGRPPAILSERVINPAQDALARIREIGDASGS